MGGRRKAPPKPDAAPKAHAAREPVRPPLSEAGRPSLMSENATLRLETGLTAGATLEGAAAFAGIGRRTLFDWLRRGRADQKLGLVTEHADFVVRIERAIAECEVESAMLIAKAGRDPSGKFWTARAWLLERRDPSKWGQRRAEPEAPDFDYALLAPGERRVLKQLLTKAQRPAPRKPRDDED